MVSAFCACYYPSNTVTGYFKKVLSFRDMLSKCSYCEFYFCLIFTMTGFSQFFDLVKCFQATIQYNLLTSAECLKVYNLLDNFLSLIKMTSMRLNIA